MECLKKQFRWKIIKRKKQVLNLCAAFGFVVSLAGGNSSFAADAVSPKTTPDHHSTLEGVSSHSQSGDDYNILMGTDHVKDYYNSFNIGRDISVNISGGSRYVAKIDENGGLSHIYGKINAPGVSLYLQNKAGLTFHASSQVNVDSILATTAGKISFTYNGFELADFGDASVINNGDIIVSNGGFAILAAPYVENNGYIQANLGHIALASTTAMTVDIRGDGLITYGVTEETLSKAGVTNAGTLKAQSGKVTISAEVASDIIDSVVNLDGVIDADSFGEGHDGGVVLISSSGDINMNDVEITADGGIDGDGGNVYTWADGVNKFGEDASISAKGGSLEGDGGTIEVSGNNISFGGEVDAAATNGNRGVIIIYPEVLRIRNGAGAIFTSPLLNIIYEKTVETLSKLGNDVVLGADSKIILENLLDNVLEGGAGGIVLKTLKNSGSIEFADKKDSISTTSGDISIEAGTGGINIGSLKTSGPNAGNIELSTNVKGESTDGDISAVNITSGDDVYINANGNVIISKINSADDVEISADKNILTGNIISGDDVMLDADGSVITKHIVAFNTGTKGADVSAEVEIDAGDSVQVNGVIFSAALAGGHK